MLPRQILRIYSSICYFLSQEGCFQLALRLFESPRPCQSWMIKNLEKSPHSPPLLPGHPQMYLHTIAQISKKETRNVKEKNRGNIINYYTFYLLARYPPLFVKYYTLFRPSSCCCCCCCSCCCCCCWCFWRCCCQERPQPPLSWPLYK